MEDLDSDCSDEIDEKMVEQERREQEKKRMEDIELKCTEFAGVEFDSFDGNRGSNWSSITKRSVKLGKETE
jgi:hypothetical protein